MSKGTITVDVNTEINLDLEDYAEEIESYFCESNCLRSNNHEDLINYIKTLYNDIFLYQTNKKDLNTVAEELERIIRC